MHGVSRQRAKTVTVVPKPEKTIDVSVTWHNLLAIDSVSQTFKADVVIRLVWHEAICDEVLALMAETPNNVHGGKVAVDYKEFMDKVWDPQFQFPNCRSKMSEAEQWMRMERHESHVKVVWAIRFKCGQFTSMFDLRKFPFDQQSLIIRISSGWDERKIQFVASAKHPSRSVYNDYALPDYRLTGNRVADVYSIDKRDAPYLCRSDPSSSNSAARYNSIFLIQCVARRPRFYVLNLYLPAFLISSSAFTSFVFYVEDFGNRTGILMTLLLTVVSFGGVIGQNLPRLPYITYLDRYNLATLGLIVLIGIVAAALSSAAVCVDAPERKPTLCGSVLPSVDHSFIDNADYVSLVVIAVFWMVYQILEFGFVVIARQIAVKDDSAPGAQQEKHTHGPDGKIVLPPVTEMTEVGESKADYPLP